MCINSRLDTEKNSKLNISFSSNSVKCFKFENIVSNNASNSQIRCHVYFFLSFVISVENSLWHIKARLVCSVHFSAWNNIYSHTFLLHNTVNFLAWESLACKTRHSLSVIVFFYTFNICTTVSSDHILIHNIKRSSVFFCKSNSISAVYCKIAFFIYIEIFWYKHI